MTSLPTCVLITPARNEAQFIEGTIESVVAQTVRPLKWIIVSDGSTDGTDELVRKYATHFPWIELVRMPERSERHFAGKVYAFNAGYARTQGVEYDVIASLDADVSFSAEYFEFLLQKLAEDPTLGLVGTPFTEGSNQTYDYRFTSIEHVSGACQVFRRACLEDIGGYVPVKNGIDHIAVVTARMRGWKTRTFPEKLCFHHRAMGTAQGGALTARFRIGANDYAIGNHPLWETFRTFYQMSKKPYLIGGLAILSGYLWATIRRPGRPVSRELVSFCRGEQLRRLARLLARNKVPRTTLQSSGVIGHGRKPHEVEKGDEHASICPNMPSCDSNSPKQRCVEDAELAKHISVCICTYKRTHLLIRLLRELGAQETEGLFTYSIVVVDNDSQRSAESAVVEFGATSSTNVKYYVETEQSIARARNRAVASAEGDFLAFIDDDEFPIKNWLLTLFKACHEYRVDGVLGPVKPCFQDKSPEWVVKGRFYERQTYPTGSLVDGSKGRTGNVLLRKEVFAGSDEPFKPEFRSGEDQDFFTRMIAHGHVFVWCDEAVTYEVVPPSRWKRSFMIRRALLRGAMQPRKADFGIRSIAKSAVAIPAYLLALPFGLLLGHHRFMAILIRLCDHLGKLLMLVGIDPIRVPYVVE